jgi:4-amino-4-deoxy-L-arabinose transferase-like glycosyltransferase
VRRSGFSSSLVAGSLLVFLLAAATRLPCLDLFIGPDEFTWLTRSARFYLALSSGNFAETYQAYHPGVTLMWVETLAVGVRMAFTFLLAGRPPDVLKLLAPENFSMALLSISMLAEKRLALALFNAVIVVAVYLLARSAFDDKVGLLAAVLIALDPLLLTESRVLRPEALLAGFAVLSVLALLVYLKSGTRGYLLLSGVMGGLAFLSKITALVLVPFAGLVALAFCLQGERSPQSRLRLLVAVFLGWSLVAVGTVFMLWPVMWVKPLWALGQIFGYAASAPTSAVETSDTFFLGRVISGDPGPWFYPVVLLLRSTPLVWPGVAVAVGVALAEAWRSWRRVRRREDTALSEGWLALRVGALLAFFLLYGAAMTLGAKKADRYMVPLAPVVDILAALGLVWLAYWVGWRTGLLTSLFGRPYWALGLVAALLIQGVTILPVVPYYYNYYNPLLGGLQRAVQVLPIGAGEGVDQAIAYLNAKPGADRLTLLCGTNVVRCNTLFAGKTLSRQAFQGEWIQADYILLYIAQMQGGEYPDAVLAYLRRQEPEYVVRLNGVEYTWLYKVPRVPHFGGAGRVEGQGVFLGYNLSTERVAPGEQLNLRLYWENLSQGEGGQLFVRVVDDRGYTWAQAISQPADGFEEAARVRHSIVESRADLEVPVGTPPGVYNIRFGFYAPSARSAGGSGHKEVIGEFTLPPGEGMVTVVKGGPLPSVSRLDVRYPVQAPVGEGLELLGYDLSQDEVAPGQSFWLALYWRAGARITRKYAACLWLLDRSGVEVQKWERAPVGGQYPAMEWDAGEIVKNPWPLAVPEDLAPANYEMILAVVDYASGAEVGRVSLGPLRVVERIPSFDVPTMQYAVGIRFGQSLELAGYDLDAELVEAGARLQVTLYWRALAEMDRDYVVFVHILDSTGRFVTGHDSEPVGGTLPTSRWIPGEVVRDRHDLALEQVLAGRYNLEVGLYERGTRERLAVTDQAGAALGDRFLVEDIASKVRLHTER